MRLTTLGLLILIATGCSSVRNIRSEAITPDFQSRLTVMTFNIRHGCGRQKWGSTTAGFFRGCDKRYEEIIAAIKSVDPDVVGLQEVRRGQAGKIAEALGMNYTYGSHNGYGYGSSWGNAVLSKFKILESDTKAIRGSVGRNRSLVSATVLVNETPVAFMSVHTDHRLNDSRSVEHILRHADALSIPVVLIGDFNMTPRYPSLSPITEDAGFIDTAREAERQGRQLGTWGSPRAARIDYVFVQPEFFDVLQAALVAEAHHRASDHLAYYTVIEWK